MSYKEVADRFGIQDSSNVAKAASVLESYGVVEKENTANGMLVDLNVNGLNEVRQRAEVRRRTDSLMEELWRLNTSTVTRASTRTSRSNCPRAPSASASQRSAASSPSACTSATLCPSWRSMIPSNDPVRRPWAEFMGGPTQGDTKR